MKPLKIIEETKKLDLPIGEYIVLGSGILGALGIRDIKDIDLLVSPRVFDELKTRGWKYGEIEIDGRIRQKLWCGDAEAFKDFWYGGVSPNPKKMIAEAIMVEGIPFLSLEKLLEIKHSFDRPKDHEDIKLIEEYLGKRNQD